jgi:hypothetical protein
MLSAQDAEDIELLVGDSVLREEIFILTLQPTSGIEQIQHCFVVSIAEFGGFDFFFDFHGI